jgi:prepilin-type N-terminal cleavage/methylation domain-containing protein
MHRAESQRGFTLTEVLMAVGILGVGLTMVASIFPVAVDQSRLSRDQTCAALCARSGAAMMRIRRADILSQLRDRLDIIQDVSAAPWAGQILDNTVTIYDPEWFLYRTGSPRTYEAAQTWTSAGHYAYRIFSGRTSQSGPHRVVIAVCKTSGAEEENPAFDRDNLAQIYWFNYNTPPPNAGQYVLNATARRTMAYLLDYVEDRYDRTNKTGYLACGQPYLLHAGSATIPPDPGFAFWFLPGVIAVYHTYLGE